MSALTKVTLVSSVEMCSQSEGEAPSLRDGMGRVAYEQSGETFFLPFGLEDIEITGQRLQAGDKVEFFISTDEKLVTVELVCCLF